MKTVSFKSSLEINNIFLESIHRNISFLNFGLVQKGGSQSKIFLRCKVPILAIPIFRERTLPYQAPPPPNVVKDTEKKA